MTDTRQTRRVQTVAITRLLRVAIITLIESVIIVFAGIGPILVHLYFSDRF